MKKSLFIFSLISAFSAFAADTGSSTALSVELDGPVRTQQGLTAGDFTGVANPRLLWRAKSLVTPGNIKALTASFREIEGSTHGIANVFHGLTDRIKQDHQVDIKEWAPTLVDCFCKPELSEQALGALRKAKERENCVVLGSTHFDASHFATDKAKWGEVHPEDVFDGYVVSRFNHYPVAEYQSGDYTHRNSTYMVNAADAVRPKQAVKDYAVKTGKYFDVVRAAGQNMRRSVTDFVHVDPSQACVDQANVQKDFKGVLYQQPVDLSNALQASHVSDNLSDID